MPECVTAYFDRFSAEAYTAKPYSFNQYWQTPAGCSTSSKFTGVGTAAANNPISYAPAFIAVALLRALGAPISVIFFGGRFATLLGFYRAVLLAMRITPVGRQVFFVLGLLPVTLLLASSFSADPITISLAALSVHVDAPLLLESVSGRRDAVLLFVVLFALALAKPDKFIFAPLVFIVPNRVIGWRRPMMLRIIALALVTRRAPECGTWQSAMWPPVLLLFGLDSHAQTHFILEHPMTTFQSTGPDPFCRNWRTEMDPRGLLLGRNSCARTTPTLEIGIVALGSIVVFYAYQLQVGVRRMIGRGAHMLALLPTGLALVGALIVETTLYVSERPFGS